MSLSIQVNNYLSGIIWTASRLQNLQTEINWTKDDIEILRHVDSQLDDLLTELEEEK